MVGTEGSVDPAPVFREAVHILAVLVSCVQFSVSLSGICVCVCESFKVEALHMVVNVCAHECHSP